MAVFKSPIFATALVLALAALLAGCAGAGYVDPGSHPARVRVKVDLPTDRSAFNQFDETTPYTSWDWGLWLEQHGRLTRLPPDPAQQLNVIQTSRLVRDTVFLAPPGRHSYRLIINGYVGVLQGWTYWPVNVVLVDERRELDLAPGQELTITPKKVLSGVAAQERAAEPGP